MATGLPPSSPGNLSAAGTARSASKATKATSSKALRPSPPCRALNRALGFRTCTTHRALPRSTRRRWENVKTGELWTTTRGQTDFRARSRLPRLPPTTTTAEVKNPKEVKTHIQVFLQGAPPPPPPQPQPPPAPPWCPTAPLEHSTSPPPSSRHTLSLSLNSDEHDQDRLLAKGRNFIVIFLFTNKTFNVGWRSQWCWNFSRLCWPLSNVLFMIFFENATFRQQFVEKFADAFVPWQSQPMSSVVHLALWH